MKDMEREKSLSVEIDLERMWEGLKEVIIGNRENVYRSARIGTIGHNGNWWNYDIVKRKHDVYTVKFDEETKRMPANTCMEAS